MDEKKCPDCGHPMAACEGEFIKKDDALEYVAETHNPYA